MGHDQEQGVSQEGSRRGRARQWYVPSSLASLTARLTLLPATPKTPKTPKAKATPTPRKRTKKVAEDGGDEEAGERTDSASPKKKARKSPVKKTPTKVVAKEDEVTALVEATKDVVEEESAVKAEVTDE